MAVVLVARASTTGAAAGPTPRLCRLDDGPPVACVGEADGGMWSLPLSDGMTLLLSIESPDLGVAWIDRGGADQYPDPEGADYRNVRPWELGELRPETDRPGCWTRIWGGDRHGIDRICVPGEE